VRLAQLLLLISTSAMATGAWSATDVPAQMETYCTSCHNAEDWAGSLDLTGLDATRVATDAGSWEKVVRKLRAGMMPPPGKPRPSPNETTALVEKLESTLDAQVALAPAAPVLHRLNRNEYANAIRDLFGLSMDVHGMLPPDDASEGFDNVAAGLGLSPALIQGYTTAAMKLGRAAVGDLTAGETTTVFQTPERLAQDQHLEGLPLGSRGGVRIEYDFPVDAEYHFSVRSSFSLARGAGVMDVALDGIHIEAPNLRDFRVPVKAGRHVLTATIFDTRRPAGVNDIYAGYKVEGAIDSVEIAGPFNATGTGDTESRRRIFSCRPQSAAQEADCARRILVDLASRAFRAPQEPDDLATILQFYERGRDEGGFEAGIQHAISRMLIDPRFLFRFESEPVNIASGAAYAISDLELASRLSFFLWSSIPDAELIDLAVRNKLRRPEVLAAQTRRMLADRKAFALVENFAGQWLHLRELATVTPEVAGFDENLREAFAGETRALVDWMRTEDRPVTELLTAEYSFLNDRLARHYGIPAVRGSYFRKVNLPTDSHRRGLLGHGSILTVTSTASRTSPVIRGSWILENLLAAPVPAPPPGVETNLDGDGTQVITTSVRQRLELHRENPSCAGCHNVMDPVGFALENFDPIGAWRDRDGDSPIDASGTLVDGTRIDGAADLTQALLGHQVLFVTNVTEKLMIYALGRAIEPHDMPTIRAIVRQAQRQDLRFSSLILGIVQSPLFLQRMKAPSQTAIVARE
jgi:hypothetical protein